MCPVRMRHSCLRIRAPCSRHASRQDYRLTSCTKWRATVSDSSSRIPSPPNRRPRLSSCSTGEHCWTAGEHRMKAYFLVSSSYSDPKNCASNIQSRSSVLTSIACIDERLVVADVITRNRLYNEAVDFPMDRTAVKRTSFDEEERTRPSLVYW